MAGPGWTEPFSHAHAHIVVGLVLITRCLTGIRQRIEPNAISGEYQRGYVGLDGLQPTASRMSSRSQPSLISGRSRLTKAPRLTLRPDSFGVVG